MAHMYIEAWVEGEMPILIHRPTDLENAATKTTRKNTPKEQEDPRTIAGRAIYRLQNSEQLALPGAAFARMIREAGGNHKATGSRKTVKYLVPAAVLVVDELCGMYLHDRKTPIVDFEVDSRSVVLPSTKGRIMRHRARCNEWAARVTLRINEEILSEAMVRTLLSEGVQQIGLGDFRPEKGGPFGTSSLVIWERVSAQPKKTPAQMRNGGPPVIQA